MLPRCARSEMDITTDFGSVIVGSSPAGRTKRKIANCFAIFLFVRAVAMSFFSQKERHRGGVAST